MYLSDTGITSHTYVYRDTRQKTQVDMASWRPLMVKRWTVRRGHHIKLMLLHHALKLRAKHRVETKIHNSGKSSSSGVKSTALTRHSTHELEMPPKSGSLAPPYERSTAVTWLWAVSLNKIYNNNYGLIVDEGIEAYQYRYRYFDHNKNTEYWVKWSKCWFYLGSSDNLFIIMG